MQRDLLTSLPQDHRDFLKSLLSERWCDSCPCACSAQGCTSLIVALRFLLPPWWRKDATPAAFLQALITETQDLEGCANKVIQLFTFQDLSLTHTCCRTYRDYDNAVQIQLFDRDDAEEIHDDERVFIEEFEALVEELQSEYETRAVLLWEFIQTYWSGRVREYLVEHEEPITPDLLCVLLAKRVIEDK
ncbi:hypothetical protein BJX65DRAFT_315335 [Aspergillus insuetus]